MASYTLYHENTSICCNMVRYTLELRGKPKDAASAMSMTEQSVNIYTGEQLQEWYLCDVNAKGQVPALASPTMKTPVTDSLVITRFICERYPQLVPELHRAQIEELLVALHKINYFSLTFSGKKSANFAPQAVGKIDSLLADSSISERYRKALTYKREVTRTEKVGALDPGVPEHNAELSAKLLDTCARLLQPDKGPWLWGLESATALDAHLVVFIMRLQEIGRESLVPQVLKDYAAKAMAGPAWHSLTEGRKITPTGI